MITITGYAGLGSSRRIGRGGRGLNGLGQMPQLTGPQYAALTPAQQQAYGNGDPNFMLAGTSTAGVTNAATAAGIPPATQALVANPQFATIPFGTSTTTTFTLDSYMARWAAGAIAFPTSLQGADPMSEAVAVAQSYCAQESMPDCNQLSAIANKYGSQVAMAFAAHAASGAASPVAAPGTTSATQPTSVIPPYCGGGVSPIFTGTQYICPSPASAPVVVSPSPASQPVTTGSSTASAGSVSSVANGTSLLTSSTGCVDANGNTIACPSTDIIPGIPNGVLLLGGAAAVVALIVAMGGK